MKRIAKFEKVSKEQFVKDCYNGENYYNNIEIPKRATGGSAGHDISVTHDTILLPGCHVKIPTGLRCKMEDGYVMLIFPRSSLGVKGLRILNTTPVIDSDYFYANNEGHIMLFMTNEDSAPITLKAGDRIAQAVFVPFGTADEDSTIQTQKRNGGFGSTGK